MPRPAIMPRRLARISPTVCDGVHDPTVMEMGDRGRQQQQQQQQQQQDFETRISVAATDARIRQDENHGAATRAQRFLAEAFSVVLLGLIVGSSVLFAYVWVDSFRKGRFNEALGLVTLVFSGLVVCAWVARRRLRSATQLPARMQMGELLERRPKGVPPQVRQNFDYFFYPGPSSCTALETSATSSGESNTNCSPLTFQSATGGADIEAADVEAGHTSVVQAKAPALAGNSGGESCSARGEELLAPTPSSPDRCYQVGREQRENQAHLQRAKGGLQQQHSAVHQHPAVAASATTTTATDPFSWADCTVCLEAYSGGDRVCRITCAHVFHAECIDNWLDQNHNCPECQVDLLRTDGTNSRGELPSERDVSDQARSIPVSTPPDEALPTGSSSGHVSPPSTPSAVAQVPTTLTSDSNPTPPPSHPNPVYASRTHSSNCIVSTSRASASAQRQPSPGAGRTSLPDASLPIIASTQAHTITPDTTDDVTEINTAINATANDSNARRLPPFIAPYACYLGSPCTQSPTSPRSSVVRFMGVSPELQQQERTTTPSSSSAAQLPDIAAARPQPRPLPSPYAGFFNSPPRTQSFSQGDTHPDLPQPSSAESPYQYIIDSIDNGAPTSPAALSRQRQQGSTDLKWSPFSPTPSDDDDDDDVTEINTVINATANDNSASPPVTAPYACFLGSPCTQSQSSPRTSVVRSMESSPGLQQQQRTATSISSAAHMPEHTAATPQPSSVAPHASLFISPPYTQSRTQGDTLTETPQPSSTESPYQYFLDSLDYGAPISPATLSRRRQSIPTDLERSPYSPTPSDTTDDMTDINTVINATANDSNARRLPPVTAPYACYLGSPCTQSPTSPRTSIVHLMGLSSEPEQQHPPATSIFSATHMQGESTPQLASVAPYAGFFNSPGTPSPRQRGARAVVPFSRSSGGELAAPYACYLDSPCSLTPPLGTTNTVRFRLSPKFVRAPGTGRYPELVSRRPPVEGGRHQPSRPPSSAAPVRQFSDAPSSVAFAMDGGHCRGERHKPSSFSSSSRLFMAGSETTVQTQGLAVRGGVNEREDWVWPLSSASMWGNKAWPAIGERVWIASLDEGAEVHPEGGGHNRGRVRWGRLENEGVAEAAGVTDTGGGRWVWEADLGARVERQHQQYQQHQRQKKRERHCPQ